MSHLISASGNTAAGGTAYGSLYNPTESGSRGGGSQAGYGGGKVYIKVPAIILIDGDILADGSDATGGEHGGGSGGSILIEAGMCSDLLKSCLDKTCILGFGNGIW